MKFKKIDPEDNPPILPPGEEAFEITLDNGRVVFASCWTDADPDARKAGRFGVIAAARPIERIGNPILNTDLSMIFAKGVGSIAITTLIKGGIVDESNRQAVYDIALTNAIESMLAELLLVEGI